MALYIHFRQFLALVLCWNLAIPLPLVQASDQSAEPIIFTRLMVKSSQVRSASGSTPANTPELHTLPIGKNHLGSYGFALDESLLEQDDMLYLIDNAQPVGVLAIQNHTVVLQGMADYDFTFSGPAPTNMSSFTVTTNGQFTLERDVTLLGALQLAAAQIAIEGELTSQETVLLKAAENLSLNGEVDGAQVILNGKHVNNAGALHALQEIVLNAETFENRGDVHSEWDIKGSVTDKFDNYGSVRFKGNYSVQGTKHRPGRASQNFLHYTNHEGSKTFVGLVQHLDVDEYHQYGDTFVSTLSVLNAQTAYFHPDSQYSCFRSLVNTDADLNIAPRAHLSAWQFVNLNAGQDLILGNKKGPVYNTSEENARIWVQSSRSYTFPYQEYFVSCLMDKQQTYEARQQAEDLDLRFFFDAKIDAPWDSYINEKSSVTLRAGGNLYQHGEVFSDVSSITYQSVGKFSNKGKSDSGKLSWNHTHVQAQEAETKGWMRSWEVMSFNIDDLFLNHAFLVAKDLQIHAGTFDNRGDVEAWKTLQVHSTGDIFNFGSLFASELMHLTGVNLDNKGYIFWDEALVIHMTETLESTQLLEGGALSAKAKDIKFSGDVLTETLQSQSETIAIEDARVEADVALIEASDTTHIERSRLEARTQGKIIAEYLANPKDSTFAGGVFSFDINGFEGGVERALDFVDGCSDVRHVLLSMKNHDWMNTGQRHFGHTKINVTFRSITNAGGVEGGGDVVLYGKEFFTNKAGKTIRAEGSLTTKTDGRHLNLGGLSSGEHNIQIGKTIEAYITEEMQATWWGLGLLSRRTARTEAGGNVIMLAEEGITQEGVDIKAGGQLHAKSKRGDINFSAYGYDRRGRYGPIREYQSTTVRTGGNQVYETTGRMVGRAMDGQAGGSILMKADQGVDLNGYASVYIKNKWNERSGLWGFNKRSGFEEDVQFSRTNLQSVGPTQIESKDGDIQARGANMGASVLIMDALGDVDLGAIKATAKSEKHSSSWWGLKGQSERSSQEKAAVFTGKAGQLIKLKSRGGKIKSEGGEIEAPSIILDGEKGIDWRDLELQSSREFSEYGFKLKIFGVDILDPMATKGPSTSVSIGYSQSHAGQILEYGKHGKVTTDHLVVRTGKGAGANFQGTDLGGLSEEDIQEVVVDTDFLLLGGSRRRKTSDTDHFGASIGFDFASWTPCFSVEGGMGDGQKTTWDAGKVRFGNLHVKREDMHLGVGKGVDGGVKSSSGKRYDATVTHEQTSESENSWHADIGVGVSEASLSFGVKGGEQRTSNVTNFSFGDTPNLREKKDIRYQDKDTRFGVDIGVTVSSDPSKMSIGGSVQIGDKGFSFDTQTVQNLSNSLQTLPQVFENIGNLGESLSSIQSFGDFLDMTQDTVNFVAQGNNLLESVGVEIPGMRDVLNHSQGALNLMSKVNDNFQDGALLHSLQNMQFPENLEGFLSQTSAAMGELNSWTDAIQGAGIPIPEELASALKQGERMVSGADQVYKKVKDFNIPDVSSLKFHEDFDSFMQGAHGFLQDVSQTFTELEPALKQLNIPVPAEVQTFIDHAGHAFAIGHKVHGVVQDGSFFESLKYAELPQNLTEMLQRAGPAFDALKETRDVLKTHGVNIDGLDGILDHSDRIVQGAGLLDNTFQAIAQAKNVTDNFNTLMGDQDALMRKMVAGLGKLQQEVQKHNSGEGLLPPEAFTIPASAVDFLDSGQAMLQQGAHIYQTVKTHALFDTLIAEQLPDNLQTLVQQSRVFAERIPELMVTIGITNSQKMNQFLQTSQIVVDMSNQVREQFKQGRFSPGSYASDLQSFIDHGTEAAVNLQQLFKTFRMESSPQAQAIIEETASLLGTALQIEETLENVQHYQAAAGKAGNIIREVQSLEESVAGLASRIGNFDIADPETMQEFAIQGLSMVNTVAQLYSELPMLDDLTSELPSDIPDITTQNIHLSLMHMIGLLDGLGVTAAPKVSAFFQDNAALCQILTTSQATAEDLQDLAFPENFDSFLQQGGTALDRISDITATLQQMHVPVPVETTKFIHNGKSLFSNVAQVYGAMQ